ncbi:condensin complex subunit 2/barren [Lineolata rhizophorae]|uniref:Condensin complex subunit 2 n=1 Tax=Lineolata rhizophorae TaxID=578093 RepID=A0A6A6NTG0_9PEZI|nr:condensin complex subunit 2/barren [Lineolata rhizophorae]
MPRARERYSTVATPHKSPMKIPLNDDRREKANRLQSRQALHEMQMNQIKAAATPIRGRKSLVGTSPHTPGNQNDDDGMPAVSGHAVTPMKRVPILANFEEWMKMATDNKINATNSWNFALIDYFHDMSLLKEGDGVNFQRASCTLDGCVKIYTSRVDSVATETGRLLSGLADSSTNKKRKGDEEDEDAEDDDGEENEDGTKKTKKKRTQRSYEATLASSFAQLQLKKMELELSVDPLFKKASADFDEGGAKGLLLNHLAIDGNGRIVFDSSDDAQDAAADGKDTSDADISEESRIEEEEAPSNNPDINITDLATKFFPDLSRLAEQDICPSLKNLDLGDPNGSLDLPFLKAPEDWREANKNQHSGTAAGDPSGIFLDDENAMGFDDDDDVNLGGFDLPPETGFGEGGEAWAKDAALDPQMRVHMLSGDGNDGGMGDGEEGMDGEVGAFEPGAPAQYAVALRQGHEDDHGNILGYFDQALQKNWAGPEHWRIRRIKDMNSKAAAAASAGPKRKEKEPFEIDFAAPMSQALADALYTPASSNSTVSLPKSQWKSKTRNLLPDDKHFNSRQLLRLFLKPKARMGSRRPGAGSGGSGGWAQQGAGGAAGPEDQGEVDEGYWARKENSAPPNPDDEEAPQGDYDANFFQDDGLGVPGGPDDDDADDVFADAREAMTPPVEGAEGEARPGIDGVMAGANGQEGAFGAQLVAQSRRVRPEYVQYARVAKKVDVRRLKEEMWRGIGFEKPEVPPTPSKPLAAPVQKAEDGSLKFTEVISNLQTVYPKQAMADISTSYCFICLLHLANEKGLVISNEENFQELTIRRDLSAEISEVEES